MDCVTLGQYMQPTKLHLKVPKFVTFSVDHPLLVSTIFGWHCHNKWLESKPSGGDGRAGKECFLPTPFPPFFREFTDRLR